MNAMSRMRRLCVTACVVASCLAFAPSANAQSWEPGGPLSNVGAADHTATLLPDGRVLIAGGGEGTASAGLYDPSTNSFSLTGSMHIARANHTATLLANGKVLIAGGGAEEAELYDPQTGLFTLTGSMLGVRGPWSTATLLANGKVLITGGWFGPSDDDIDGSAELYDPATGLFTGTPGMSIPRQHHSATLLPDGRVLIAGGLTTGPLWNVTTKTCEIYDPATGTFSPTGAMHDTRMSHTATLLPDGKVLMAAGLTVYPWVVLASAELFDPATGTFAVTGSLNEARHSHTATLLSDGEILITGGGGGSVGVYISSAELYSPLTGVFSPAIPMSAARAYHTATLLPDGTVLVAEGSVEVYHPIEAGGAFSPTGHLKDDRAGFTATLLPDGKVLVAGGYTGGGVYLSSAELYSKGTGGYAPTGSMADMRVSHAAVLLANGKVLVTGGSTGSVDLASAELYDPAAGTFGAAGAMTAARTSHTATRLANGKVLIAGGYAGSTLSSAEIYDPGIGAFSPTGAMSTARAGHSATLLSTGEVLIVGGTDSGGWPLASAELYNPASGTFSPTGALGTKREEHTAALLLDGRVLVAGGYGQVGSGPLSALDSAEIYDRGAGSFSPTGSMLLPREYPTATRLLNGKVLVAGGTLDLYAQPTLAWAELFDPDTGAFSLVGSMGTARVHHRATLLDDGRVLIAGGYGWGNYLFFSELFVPSGETTYSATVWSWDYIAGWLAMPITEDGSATGFSTPHTFTGLTGSHTFTVPGTDSQGHPFSDWDTGWTDRTITVSEAGTYTARYRAGYSVTIWSWCEVDGWLASPITMDGVATGYTTPHTFSDLTGTHTFTPPSSHADGHPFYEWSTGSTGLTLTVSEAGTYTARYHLASVLPDLVESVVSEPPTAGYPGMIFGVTDTAANQGTAAAGLSTTRYFLSLDQLKSRFDPPVANRSVPELAISATSAGGVSATIPADIALGTYYLLACADILGAVTELVETNNCRASTHAIVIAAAAWPDLIENWVDNPPASAAAGSSIEVSDQAGNPGNAAAGASTTRYYLSLDTIKDAGDPRLGGWRSVPALAVGTVAGGTITATIPVATVPGAYYLIACADDLGVVAESNETNNCLASVTKITVGAAAIKTAFDFNGDHKSDILWRHAAAGDMWLWPMSGGVKSGDAYVGVVNDSNWEIRGQGDLDGDGKADVLWRNKATGMIYYWKMDGATPVQELYVGTVDLSYDIVGTGDFDGDGKADILWRNPAAGDLWLWRMNGATILGGQYIDTVAPSYQVKGLGDLNGDTKTDLVWQGPGGDVWVWLMNGAARDVQQYVGTVADATYQIQQVADFDADGKADLLWWNSAHGDVWVWLMNGAAAPSPHYVGIVPDTTYHVLAAGDYDGDGHADILWQNAVAGDLWVWLMNGTTKTSQTCIGAEAVSGYQVVRTR